MTEKKRRQGQKKPDGRTATPKPICPKCDEYLQRCYTRGILKTGKRGFIESGWMCPSSTCDYVIKDLVILEDTEGEE
jgi:hypothetical protein